MRVLEAVAPAVVLGSSQPGDHVDAARAAAAGVEVARRRSGGGAVLVGPGRCCWVDLAIGAHDARWDDDVGGGGWGGGGAWVDALAEIGVAGAEVWRGPLVRSAWSDRICFAGVGPGEVTVGGRKVVGISQRRTRGGALFQCAALLDGNHAELLRLLSLGASERDDAAGELRISTAALGHGAAEPLVVALASVLGARPAFGGGR
jgi:lipoate-protein ligase A